MRNVFAAVLGILLMPGLVQSAQEPANVVGEIVKVEANRSMCGGRSGTLIVVKLGNGGMTEFFVEPRMVVTGNLKVCRLVSAHVMVDRVQDSEVAVWVKTTDK
jgi:hypothetical protein